MAIADAILNGRSYQESLLDWCRRYPSPKGAYGGRFAGWIRSLDPQPYNSFGNGSAMRVSPVAWLFDDLSQVLEEAEKTALPTHNHPEGIKGAKAVAHAIWHFRKSNFSEESATGGAGVADPQLFSILKDLRKKMAKQLDLPPYVIFQESSLQDMATFYPINEMELQNISGVGLSKAKKYGKPFLEVISEYVHDNEIDRPEDIRIRTVPNKSKLKVSIVQMIDRKVSLEDIANTYNLDFPELLSELEAIVYSGTKININYFISDVMEEEAIDEIFDYFKHSVTDDIETAMSELGVYEEEEIRLIRVKFISEMAN